MHQLGSVLHISKNHSLVLQCGSGKPAKEKAVVFNKENKKIGVISEIFGPVQNPYITVKPVKSADIEKMVGIEVYVK
jgi:RNA-binding protein